MKNLYILLFALVLIIQHSKAQNIPSKPQPAKFVNDFANIMTPADARKLEDKLKAYNDSTSTQIVIVTINSLEGSTIESYSVKLAQSWGIGQKGVDNGLLILMSKNDRGVRIEEGYGMEAIITDLRAKNIIDENLIPNFKNGNFYKAFDEATDRIIQLLSGTFDEGDRNQSKSSQEDNTFYLILRLMIGAVLVLSCVFSREIAPPFSFFISLVLIFTYHWTFLIEAIISFIFIDSGSTSKKKTYSSKSTYKTNYSSSYSDTTYTSSYSDYKDYSDYSDSYSDYSDYSDSSYGGGSFGGGGASGSW